MKRKVMIAVIAVVIVGVIVGIALTSEGSNAAIEKLLTKYYTAYFTTASIEEIQACLPTELREDADLAFTLGGTMNLLINNKMDMISKMGENYTVAVKVISRTKPSAEALNKLRSKYYGVNMAITADFEITVTGEKVTVKYAGTAPLTKIGSNWFLSEHSLPLYEK